MAGIQQHDCGMRADETGAASQKNVHGNSLLSVYPNTCMSFTFIIALCRDNDNDLFVYEHSAAGRTVFPLQFERKRAQTAHSLLCLPEIQPLKNGNARPK